MTTCLVLGAAACLHEDIKAYTGPIDGVVAVNDAITEWPGDLTACVSLHARQYFAKPGWLALRAAKGYPKPAMLFGHPEAFKGRDGTILTGKVTPTPFEFYEGHPSGSSGLFAAKVALVDLGFDRVVFCGVPMSPGPHIAADWRKPGDENRWTEANAGGTSSALGFRNAWLTIPMEYRNRMRSMSGWSRVLLGAPETMKETA